MTELTKEDLLKYKDYLTVGKLKEFIDKYNLSDNSLILVERVEDIYYDKHNWGSYLKKGYMYYIALKYDIFAKKENDLKEHMTQYHPIFCAEYYDDDKDILFLNLHY